VARKPDADLGDMAISKASAAEAVPFSTSAAQVARAAAGPQKSLTVKLDGGTYAALREYCYARERESGSRLTHQQVMVAALKAFLEQR
jgi:hypothetical protein